LGYVSNKYSPEEASEWMVKPGSLLTARNLSLTQEVSWYRPGLPSATALWPRLITPDTRPQIATVRYGVFWGGEAGGSARLLPVNAAPLPPAWTQIEELTILSTNREEADCVRVLGDGIPAREDIGLFRKMSQAIGAELICSRSLVERGWFP
jgi:electron transfer flavoprotein alpha subunit